MATWSEVMEYWAKGLFSESAGFNRDLHAERFFAADAKLDVGRKINGRRDYAGPSGAAEWLADKDDFDFGKAPHEAVGGAAADEVHQKLPGGGYCTWTIRGGMVHAFVAKPSAGADAWAKLTGGGEERRATLPAGGTLYRC